MVMGKQGEGWRQEGLTEWLVRAVGCEGNKVTLAWRCFEVALERAVLPHRSARTG